MYKISKPQAIWKIGVPYVSNSMWNQINPYHHTHFNELSFDFFDTDKLKKRSYHRQIDVELKVKSVEYKYFESWANKPPKKQKYARKHYWNVVRALNFIIEVVK